MTPYDENPPTRRSRQHDWDDDYPGGRDHDEPPTGRGQNSPAPQPFGPTPHVGRASVGRASVPGAVPPPPPEPSYEPSYGVDPYGPTYDPYAQSRDSYAPEPYAPEPGYGGGYPEPLSPPRGVGRASVRPVSPSSNPYPPMGPGGPGVGPGGPMGPGGPGGPGGRGPGGRFPRNPFGRGRGDGTGPDKGKRSKSARRRNIIIASFAVLIMLTGAGFVGGTYFVDSVKTPDQLVFPETTIIYYGDGATPLAKLGEVTRFPLKYEEMNDAVVQSIVASEDKTFWTNEGVDFSGVLRAAWNNFTGGSRQGGSTITQQYARVAFDLEGATYMRKAREAVLAWKISDSLKKEQILEYYLNSVPFGRQTYGIEAAAQSFFGKTVKKTAPPEQQITKAEAMALVLMVKQPNPDPADPKGSPGYDPTLSPEAEALSKGRWEYVRDQMVELKYLTPEENAALKYPREAFKVYNPDEGNGVLKPAGLVVRHVLSELTHNPRSPFNGWDWRRIREGGYKIYTTLNPGAQAAAEHAADETVAGSPINGQPANLQAALVGIEPGTGRVLAYFGGHDGKGSDYAGIYYDEKGDLSGFGAHPPGSSFKVYTLAAALKSGISLKSYWNWQPHDMPGREGTNQIRNASSCPGLQKNDPTPCSLLDSTTASLNIPFYELTVSVTPAKVLEMARDAGVDYMWNDKRQRQQLFDKEPGTLTPSQFDFIMGIGQYPITVMDHANGLATFAANGLRAQAHFVLKVVDGDKTVYGETLPKQGQPTVINPQASNDLTYALSKVSSAALPGVGWDSAGKTGTWQYANSLTENAHAWMVGFTHTLAAAVWVGNKDKEQAIKLKNGTNIFGSQLPAPIWKKFMTDAMKAMNPKKVNTKFNPPSFIGNENPDRSVPSPTPSQPVQPPDPTVPPTVGPSGAGGIVPTPRRTH